MGEKTLHAKYLCNDTQCKLIRAYYAGPTVYRLAESSLSSEVDSPRSMPNPDLGSIPCDLGAKKSSVENSAIVGEVSSKLIADLVVDSSCQANALGQELDKIADDLREDFASFLNSMVKTNVVSACLPASQDAIKIEKMMKAKLGEIKSGKLPFSMKCMLDPTGRWAPEISENPLVMTIPILGSAGTG